MKRFTNKDIDKTIIDLGFPKHLQKWRILTITNKEIRLINSNYHFRTILSNDIKELDFLYLNKI